MSLTRKDLQVIATALAHSLQECVTKAMADHDDRIATLEARAGIVKSPSPAEWEPRGYPAASMVTKDGSSWISVRPTSDMPGGTGGGWRQLIDDDGGGQ